jgi:2-oxoglutarate ferredoxin oxidoreductase subunit gamma
MTVKILLTGFGGQGILFAGKFLAYCGMLSGREVSWLPSYGPEMRGGTANCSVVISDEAVGSPIVLEPDILIAMNAPSFEKYLPSVVPGGRVFADSSLIRADCARTDLQFFASPATQLATDEKLEGLANMILLGLVLRETKLMGDDVVQEAMRKTIPPRKQQLFDKNMQALLFLKKK